MRLPILPPTLLVVLALTAAGCSKTAEEGQTAEMGSESAGSEADNPLADEELHGESGTGEIEEDDDDPEIGY